MYKNILITKLHRNIFLLFLYNHKLFLIKGIFKIQIYSTTIYILFFKTTITYTHKYMFTCTALLKNKLY